MTLQTKRLILHPLSVHELELWASDIPSLERELGCRYEGEPVEGSFRDIVQGQIAVCKRDTERLLYHTFWLLLVRERGIIAGAVDFKAPPNERGEVEIGYGLGKTQEKHGYMTEAVAAMRDWAFQNPETVCVTAETERDNAASQSVLRRCGFRPVREEKTLWWEYRKPEAGTRI